MSYIFVAVMNNPINAVHLHAVNRWWLSTAEIVKNANHKQQQQHKKQQQKICSSFVFQVRSKYIKTYDVTHRRLELRTFNYNRKYRVLKCLSWSNVYIFDLIQPLYHHT